MSNGTWTVLIMVVALVLPLLVLAIARGAIRVSHHPRWMGFARWLHARNQALELRFGHNYLQFVLAALYTVIAVVDFAARGRLFWAGGATAFWLLFLMERARPGWLVGGQDRMDEWFPEDGDIRAPEPQAPPAPAPSPEAGTGVWHREDRPLSASELRRRARGQQLEPPV